MRYIILIVSFIVYAGLLPIIAIADPEQVVITKDGLFNSQSNTQNTWVRKTPNISQEQVTFIQAVKLGNIEKVKHHLDAGTKPDDKQGGKYTALFFASAKGRQKIAELLLVKGADVNALGQGGWTPLMAAAFHGHVSLVNLLILHKSNLELRNYEGKTALMFAVENHQPLVASALINAGANINAHVHGKKRGGINVLALAIKLRSHECLDVLLKAGVNVNNVDAEGNTPLIQAAILNDQIAMSKLIGKRASVNRIDKANGNSVLHSIAPFANQETINLLLENGVDASHINKEGQAALALAANAGNMPAIRALLSVAKQTEKNAALVLAAESGTTNAIQELLTQGANSNSRNSRNETALMLAAQGRHHLAVEVLLGAGAVPNLTSDTGKNALMYALDTPLYKPDIVKQLIAKGADVNHKDNQGNTPLLLAVANIEKLDLHTIRSLVSAGADAEPKNVSGENVRSILRTYRKRLPLSVSTLEKIDEISQLL